MDRYPNISDHGLIGDLQTVALITRDGTWTSSAARGSTLPVSSRPCSTRTKVGISRSHRRRASSRRATRHWLSTLHALDSELSPTACLVYRYNPAASRDGLHGDEGALSLCTFLYVDALALGPGGLKTAELTFEKMQTYGNHLVGLYSEEIGSAGEQLGNFPQAFTHLALINSAIKLNEQLDHGLNVGAPVLATR